MAPCCIAPPARAVLFDDDLEQTLAIQGSSQLQPAAGRPTVEASGKALPELPCLGSTGSTWAALPAWAVALAARDAESTAASSAGHDDVAVPQTPRQRSQDHTDLSPNIVWAQAAGPSQLGVLGFLTGTGLGPGMLRALGYLRAKGFSVAAADVAPPPTDLGQEVAKPALSRQQQQQWANTLARNSHVGPLPARMAPLSCQPQAACCAPPHIATSSRPASHLAEEDMLDALSQAPSDYYSDLDPDELDDVCGVAHTASSPSGAGPHSHLHSRSTPGAQHRHQQHAAQRTHLGLTPPQPGTPAWEEGVHAAQAQVAKVDLCSGRGGQPAHDAVEAFKKGALGFAFSGGGFWFPHHLGVVTALRDLGIITPASPLAGASCGSIITACVNAGLDLHGLVDQLLEFADDCRLFGTAGRLREVIIKFMRGALPEDAHKRCSGRTYIQLTQVLRRWPFLQPVVISDFTCKEDLVQAIATSCHIPAYCDTQFTASFRGQSYVDGGLVRHIPSLPASAGCEYVAGVSCVPVSFLQTLPGISRLQLLRSVEISPDTFHPFGFAWQAVAPWLLAPAEDPVLLQMIEMGKRDVTAWASAVGLLDHLAAVRSGIGRHLKLSDSGEPKQPSPVPGLAAAAVAGTCSSLPAAMAPSQSCGFQEDPDSWHDVSEPETVADSRQHSQWLSDVVGGQVQDVSSQQPMKGSAATDLRATIAVPAGQKEVSLTVMLDGRPVHLHLQLHQTHST